MQTLPDGLTQAEVEAIVQHDDVQTSCTLTLYDFDYSEGSQVDLTSDLIEEGSYVQWHARTGVHRSCRLQLTRKLDWHTAVIQPTMTITTPAGTLTRSLGFFFPQRPRRDIDGSDTEQIAVTGYDRLELLNTPIGRTVTVSAGNTYLDAVVDLIVEIDPANDPSDLILLDQAAATVTLDADRIWSVDRRHTYLSVINGLLLAVGYRALWVDTDGYYRIERYLDPSTRAPEWTYDTTAPTTTIVHPQRSQQADWWDVPNRWIIVRDRPSAGVASGTDGTDGRLVVVNQSDGPTSIDARNGVVRNAIVTVDAADADSLATQAIDIVAEAQQIIYRRALTVEPNPMHSHLDLLDLVDDDLGSGRALTVDWTLPLDGEPMTLNAEMVIV